MYKHHEQQEPVFLHLWINLVFSRKKWQKRQNHISSYNDMLKTGNNLIKMAKTSSIKIIVFNLFINAYIIIIVEE